MDDEKLVVACPSCHKKFRVQRKIRFQCKYCHALIQPEEEENLSDSVNIPVPSVRETREQLAGTAQELNRKHEIQFYPLPVDFGKRCMYWYDQFLSKGPVAMFLTLVVLFTATWFLCSILWLLLGQIENVPLQIWKTFLQLCDPGSMDQATSKSVLSKVASVVTGILGVIIFSLLVAFLTNIFNQKMQSLKKGNTAILEQDHTLILGWSDKVATILAELIMAYKTPQVVVILSDRPKEQLDDELRATIRQRFSTKIIVRTGEISNLHDLENAGISQARSLIILSQMPKNPTPRQIILADTQIIKTILSICKNPARKPEPFHIVTELNDPKNIDIAKSIGADEVTAFYPNEIIAKILVQTSRQNGLATVYNELLSFAGNELYCQNVPEVTGRKLEEVLLHFPKAIPLGIKSKKQPAQLNPPLDLRIQSDDELILIAEDENELQYSPPKLKRPSGKLPENTGPREVLPEKQLLLGWNDRVPNILQEYGNYLAKGSEIVVAVPSILPFMQDILQNVKANISQVTIRLAECDYQRRVSLATIQPYEYDNIIILASDWDGKSTLEEIDSQTIYTLLLLRDLQQKVSKGNKTKLITELLNPANQELIQIARVNDFVISNQLISMILAQVSQQKHLYEVYDDLFNAEGSEVYLKPVSLYLSKLPAEITFADLILLAAQRSEIAFGYRIQRWEHRNDYNFGIKLNPDKYAPIWLSPDDQLIVVAEDER